MKPNEVIERLCILCTKVKDDVYKNRLASDCFCKDKKRNYTFWQFDEAILKYIETAVNKAIENENQENTLTQGSIDMIYKYAGKLNLLLQYASEIHDAVESNSDDTMGWKAIDIFSLIKSNPQMLNDLCFFKDIYNRVTDRNILKSIKIMGKKGDN